VQSFRTKPIIESEFLGYDDLHPSELLAPGKFQVADNVLISDNKIKKVTGSTAINSAIAAFPFNGLFSFEKISSGDKWLIANVDGASTASIYRSTGGNFTAINGANTFTNAKRMYAAIANDSIFGFNQTEVFDWDGTTFTKNRSGVPLGNFAQWFHNYLFVAATSANPNRLFFSNLGVPTTFTAADYVDVNPGDSDSCMGLGMLQDELFFFKRNTIWSITGWAGTTFAATTIAAQNTNVRLFGYGCIAPGSILSVGNDIYFLSFLSGTPQIRSLKKTQFAATLGGGIISYDISETMAGINKSYMANTVGVFDGRYCRWAITTGSSTTNNKLIVLDTWGIRKVKGITIYPWTTESQKNASFMTVSTLSGSAITYFSDTSTTSGLVFKFDSSVYTDNGTNITMTATPRTFMLDPSRKSKWKYLYVKFDTGVGSSLNVNARVDRAVNYTLQKAIALAGSSPGLGPTGTFTLGVSVLGGGLVNMERVTFAQLTGVMLDVQFKETSANPVGIYEFSIYGNPKGLRDS